MALIVSNAHNSVTGVGKVRILNALDDLLKDSAFEKITTTDICTRAEISRPTFYRHFANKYEVVSWFWGSLTQPGLQRLGRDMTWHEALTLIYTTGEPYYEFFIQTMGDGYESLKESSFRSWESTLSTLVRDHLHIEMTPDLEFQIHVFSAGEAHAVAHMFATNKRIVGSELATSIEKCIPVELHALIDDAVAASRAAGEFAAHLEPSEGAGL